MMNGNVDIMEKTSPNKIKHLTLIMPNGIKWESTDIDTGVFERFVPVQYHFAK